MSAAAASGCAQEQGDKKEEVINKTNKKSSAVVDWRSSRAKMILIEDLQSGKIPESWKPKQVWESHSVFQDFPLVNFCTNLQSLCDQVAADKGKAAIVAEQVKADPGNNPCDHFMPAGYPCWDLHPASELLAQDLDRVDWDAGINQKELYESQYEYQKFLYNIFTKHVTHYL
ncbi:hypothetical protein ACA910_000384 [Epithemia clementina (nom. ined.)]